VLLACRLDKASFASPRVEALFNPPVAPGGVFFSVLSVVTECIVFGYRTVAAGSPPGIVTVFLEHRPTLAVRAVIAAGAKQ
jgi:hypothetical protein